MIELQKRLFKKKKSIVKRCTMSCLFDSLSYFTLSEDANSLREKITNFIHQDPIMISPDIRLSHILQSENTNLEQYVRTMRLSDTWGGAIEIKAFCELFQVPVKVEIEADKRQIEFIPTRMRQGQKTIFISWNGNHFVPTKHC